MSVRDQGFDQPVETLSDTIVVELVASLGRSLLVYGRGRRAGPNDSACGQLDVRIPRSELEGSGLGRSFSLEDPAVTLGHLLDPAFDLRQEHLDALFFVPVVRIEGTLPVDTVLVGT